MESNGVPGKIHVSQACADEIVAQGYAGWLVEREDKVRLDTVIFGISFCSFRC